MATDKKIGFIGAGQMAEALARGFINKGVVKATSIFATDPMAERKEVFRSFKTNPVDTNIEVVTSSDVVFVAVKPQYVSAVLKEVRPHLAPHVVIVSIAAGITLQTLKDAAGEEARLVRVMPNTPCLVGGTAAAMCLGGKADDGDAELVRRLFSAVGTIYRVEEKLLSAVTGLSGSGLAYALQGLCLNKLDDAKDLANAAQVCHDWRAEVHHCEQAWQEAFVRQYPSTSVADYEGAPSWRAKYLLCTSHHTNMKLREKAEQLDELEDGNMLLERREEEALVELSQVERTLAEHRQALNALLEAASGQLGVHMGSTLGQQILQAASEAPAARDSKVAKWRSQFSQEERDRIRESHHAVTQWSSTLQQRKDALLTLVDAQAYQQECTRRVAAAVAALQAKRASLEVAKQVPFRQ